MLKRLFPVVLVAALAACSSEPKKAAETAPAAEPAKPAFSEKWTVTEGIDTPESVYRDPVSGDIFVSLIVGMPGDKDGNGHIAKLSADGKMVNANWVTGLNAPKGLRSHEGSLWTADIDEIVEIDIASGKVKAKTKVKDAKFLNDVATGPDGTVYVTDMMASRILALKAGKLSVVAEGEDMEYPNGIIVEGDSLVVGGWGKPEADFTTKVPGRLFKVDLKTKTKTLITAEPTANIDGLESDGKGGYIVSDWLAGKILRIAGDGKVETLKEFKQGTADIAFLAATGVLLIPHMNENKIVAYDVSGVIH